jgi:hypothetical protein
MRYHGRLWLLRGNTNLMVYVPHEINKIRFLWNEMDMYGLH